VAATKRAAQDPRAAARAHLRTRDRVLRRLVDAQPDLDPRAWLESFPPLDAFGTLVLQVIGQQLSVAATRRILDKVQAAFGGHLPTSAEALSAGDAAFVAAGMSRRKAATVVAIAAAFEDGTLSERRFASQSDEEIEAELTAIPGVGPWTVHGFLIIALDRPDVVLPGDLALRRAIRGCYGLDHLPTQDEVRALAEPWRPYRSLATAYLFGSEFGDE